MADLAFQKPAYEKLMNGVFLFVRMSIRNATTKEGIYQSLKTTEK